MAQTKMCSTRLLTDLLRAAEHPQYRRAPDHLLGLAHLVHGNTGIGPRTGKRGEERAAT
jgi:hypothetical protein